MAPVKSAPTKFVCEPYIRVRLALVKMAPARIAPVRLALVKLAFDRLAFDRSTPARFTLLKLQPRNWTPGPRLLQSSVVVVPVALAVGVLLAVRDAVGVRVEIKSAHPLLLLGDPFGQMVFDHVTPVNVVPSIVASVRLVFVKLAPVKFALVKSVLVRSAPVKFALVRIAPVKLA